MLSKRVGFAVLCTLGLGLRAYALVPLEGLVLGNVARDLQTDPLQVFTSGKTEGNAYDQVTQKLYRSFYLDAQELQRSCSFVGKAAYANPISEIIARRTIVASLQYVGLDITVKAIGSYAKTLQMPPEEYTRLVDSLVQGSCSPNLSVYGLRLVKQNLQASYKTEDPFLLPYFPSFPLGSDEAFVKSNSLESRETEFHHVIKNFRSLCSWGGDVNNYRLLPALLNSPQVMSVVLRFMEGVVLRYNEKTAAIDKVDYAPTYIACDGPLCRPAPLEVFNRQFPRMVGSSGIKQDFQRQWCEHFRFQNYLVGDQQDPQVREWIKQQEPEDDRKDAAAMVSLFTRVSDLILNTKQYKDLSANLRNPIEVRWNRWAQSSIERSSRDLYFEESLEVNVMKQNRLALARKNEVFALDMIVTMGELDRILQVTDKLGIDFNIKVSRNWLRWVRTSSLQAQLSENRLEAQELLLNAVTEHLQVQLQRGYQFFPYFKLGKGLEILMAEELVSQLTNYEGAYFEEFKDKMVNMPVRFHFGLFALSYIRHKALLKPTIETPTSPEVTPTNTTALTYKKLQSSLEQ